MTNGPDPARIAARLDALWDIAHGPGGGADRPAYSGGEAAAMRLVAGWARDTGLEPGLDEFGNLWALPADRSGPLLTSGSHVDTVPDGGRYDGALGTVLGLEAAAALGARTGLLICAAEEAPRFGAGTMGSRQLVGTLPRSDLVALRDADGVSAADALAAYMDELSDLPRIAPPLDRLRAHAEIHVAQRRALRELGVVTAVASPRRFAVRIEGQAGHAGEVSMAERRDALAAAAEVVLAVEAAARAEPPETVATVGALAVQPGAVSVIPAVARLAIDVRGIDAESLDRVESAIRAAVDEIAQRRGVGARLELTRAGAPAAMDSRLVTAALATARELGIAASETWSGAGHDAQHVTTLAPALLLFVPLHGGESHTPQEGADMDEIVQAARVVVSVLGAELAGA
ncbi:MAG: hydantoinase/carbamoylase family amidase [Solirubrobacteraceae bacterium]